MQSTVADNKTSDNKNESDHVERCLALEKAYVHDVYDQCQDSTKTKPWPKIHQFIKELEPGAMVCDVGCGNGMYLNVNQSVFSVGVDRCVKMTEVAKEKDKEVLISDNLQLPFKDDSFDAVLSIAVIHHFATTERRIRAIQELARLLRIGGKLIISVWAMEQRHRKFESQDVLVPLRPPQTHRLSTPSLELTSTTTTSDDDLLPAYHAYTQTSDTDSNKSFTFRKRNKTRHRSRSIDPNRLSSSPSSSSLSSPNETCYSFVRRAIQKLAGSHKRSRQRPWFLDSWSYCSKESSQEHCNIDEFDDICDLPIELRRIDERELIYTQVTQNRFKKGQSRSLTDIAKVQSRLIRSKSQMIDCAMVKPIDLDTKLDETTTKTRPRLVKQKKSINDEDDLDKPLSQRDQVDALPDIRMHNHINFYKHRRNVYKQSSMNEELLSTERLQEKENVRRNIQKQASLNEDLIYRRYITLESLRDSLSSFSTSKRFQLIKSGLHSKFKSSTTNLQEKMAGATIKSGLVKILNWKQDDDDNKPKVATNQTTPLVVDDYRLDSLFDERRHSKEDGSDSSKDSSLQSDTSVDSEDSFASVIFIPKQESTELASPLSPASPRVKSGPTSPRLKQSSCPTSPRLKPLYPLFKQPTCTKGMAQFKQIPSGGKVLIYSQAAPLKLTAPKVDNVKAAGSEEKIASPKFTNISSENIEKFKFIVEKYKQRGASENARADKLKQVRGMLTQRTGFGQRGNSQSSTNVFPMVRRSSTINRPISAKSLTRVVSLDLFNPETDDLDSDSSGVSSPDSVDSVISMDTESKVKGNGLTILYEKLDSDKAETNESDPDPSSGQDDKQRLLCIETHSNNDTSTFTFDDVTVKELTNAVDNADQTNGQSTQTAEELNECYQHLTEFAEQISENILKEIDEYRLESKFDDAQVLKLEQLKQFDDPYIEKLGEEIRGLFNLSKELTQERKVYLSKLNGTKPTERTINRSDDTLKSTNPFRPFLSLAKSDLEECHSTNTIQFVRQMKERGLGLITSAQDRIQTDLEIRSRFNEIVDEKKNRFPGRYDRDESHKQRKHDDTRVMCEKYRRRSSLLEASVFNEADEDANVDRKHEETRVISEKFRRRSSMLDAGAFNDTDVNVDKKHEETRVISEKFRRRSGMLDASVFNDTDVNVDKKHEETRVISEKFRRRSGVLDASVFNDTDVNVDKKHEETRVISEKFRRRSSILDASVFNEADEDVQKTDAKQNELDDAHRNENISITKCDVDRQKSELDKQLTRQDELVRKLNELDKQLEKDENLANMNSEDNISLGSLASGSGSGSSKLTTRLSQESSDFGDVSEQTSDYSHSHSSLKDTNTTASTASLSSCKDWTRTIPRTIFEKRSSSEEIPDRYHPKRAQLIRQHASIQEPMCGCDETVTDEPSAKKSLSDTSQESLVSEGGASGGAITYHKYYHVFREGELDSLIEKYVENLHIISSYYDHASWCVVAEKVHVWTI